MSKIMEPVLQLFTLGIFTVIVLFSAPFWVLSLIFVKGNEARVRLAATPGWIDRFMKSEVVWGSIAVVAWVSFIVRLQFN